MRKSIFLILSCVSLLACQGIPPITPTQRYNAAVTKLKDATNEETRFYALNDASKQAFILGKTFEARQYALTLLEMAPRFSKDWNYGNAIQDGNLVLGRISVQEGNIPEAKKFLIAAGKSPGSPQMDTFGPNMSLAKDLLNKGEKEVVLQYFELCRKFWELHRGRLDEWSQDVKENRMPDFGANLLY